MHNFHSINMTCKHAQSILVGEKYVQKNYLKQFLGGEGINIMLSQCNFLHSKRKKMHNLVQFTLCAKILVAKFSATFLKNKNCTTKFIEHDMRKFTPNFENNVHNKRCLRKVLQLIVLNIVFSQFNGQRFVKDFVMFYLLLGIASYVLQKHVGKFIVHIQGNRIVIDV